jgi:hypothetical protein
MVQSITVSLSINLYRSDGDKKERHKKERQITEPPVLYPWRSCDGLPLQEIVAACGITDIADYASPTRDGWLLSDFWMFNHLLRSAPVANQTWLTCCNPKPLVGNELGSDAPDTVRYGSVMPNEWRALDRCTDTTIHPTIGAAPLPWRILQHSGRGDPVPYLGFLEIAKMAKCTIGKIKSVAEFFETLSLDYKATIPNVLGLSRIALPPLYIYRRLECVLMYTVITKYMTK